MKNIKSYILQVYLSGRFTKRTEERTQQWIIKNRKINETEQASYKYWDELKVVQDCTTYNALNKVNSRIGYKKSAIKNQTNKIPLRLAAAITALVLLLGGYIYSTTDNNWTEVTAAYGEKKHILLPDSSDIWLNSGTEVKYPKKFKRNQRIVFLNGEAYFSVKNNIQKPFVVQTKQIAVKVLGTKFNVKAYSRDENTETTLTSGKVEVSYKANTIAILNPNEQLILNNRTAGTNVRKVTTEESIAWMQGKLIFNNASLKEILQTLERKFNVNFLIEDSAVFSKKRCTVKFLKNESLDDILTILNEVVLNFSYKKEKNLFFVSLKE